MTQTMVRATFVGLMTLIALARVVDVGPAEAAPTKAPPGPSPYAGTYVGSVPGSDLHSGWTITISESGAIAGSGYYAAGGFGNVFIGSGEMSGTVSDAGRVSCTGSESGSWKRDDGTQGTWSNRLRFSATLDRDASGGLTGRVKGETFVWTPQ